MQVNLHALKVRNMRFDAEQMIFLENFFSKMGIEDATLKFDAYLTDEKKPIFAEKIVVDGKCTALTKKGTRCSKNKSKLNSIGLCTLHFKTPGPLSVAKNPTVKHTKVKTTKDESIEQLLDDVEKDISANKAPPVGKIHDKIDCESTRVSTGYLSDGGDSVGNLFGGIVSDGNETEDLFGEE